MKEWQVFIKDYVVGDPPKSTKDSCKTQCSQCDRIYNVLAGSLKNNLLKNGKVVCSKCSNFNVYQARIGWRSIIRPYYPAVDSIKKQNEIVTYSCPNCKESIKVKVLTLVRGVRERNSNGFCRKCVQKTDRVSQAISKSQVEKTYSEEAKQKIAKSTASSIKKLWSQNREIYEGSFNLPKDKLEKEAKSFGFSLMGRAKDDYILKCTKCLEESKRRPHNFYKLCPHCNPSTSTAEEQIRDYIKSFGLAATRLRDVSEIDVYVAKLKFGIEHHGIYWHSERFKSKDYHYNKYVWATNKGIHLIQIFEDEWRDRKDQVKNYLSSKLGVNKKIYARNCLVAEIPPTVGRRFIDDHHIQGPSPSKVYYGLYYNEDLVGAVSAGKHHRNYPQLVLNRLCFKDGVSVVGGSSKLFKRLVKYAKDSRYNQIISWSDNRWSNGEVYKKLDFTLAEELSPDYSYAKNSIRFSKQSLRKTPEERLRNKTERELRLEQGYDRIWDCGKKRWVFSVI